MVAISSYFARVGLQVDKGQIKQVDTYLKSIEKRLIDFQKRLSKQNGALNLKVSFDTKSMTKSLGNALDLVSKKVTLEISNFSINERGLRAALLRAQRAGKPLGSAGGYGNTIINNRVLSGAEWDRREAEKQRLWWERRNALREDEARRAAERLSRPVKPGNYSYRNSMSILGAGGAGGALARYGFGALPFIGGAYGLGTLNTANQELISGQLTTQAVLAAKGYSTQQGVDANKWLFGLANNIGFNYMEALPDYNQFLSNSLGAGLGVEQSQDIFQGFSEYQTAMGVTPARRKLVQNALSQMLGKGVLSMEEVRRQMAESMPGTMDVFAQSYAEMTGSGLSGQEALAKFYEDIAKGNIESAKILPIVARILSERAAPKIDIMKKSSIAEQARSQNMQTQMLESFSKAGGETGFARLWRTATDAMREMDRVMPNIGEMFDKGTYFFRQLILLPQSIGRMFDGRDSNFQKWLFGQGETGETIMQMMFNMRDILKEIGELGGKSYEGWKMLFDLFKDSGALQTVLEILRTIQQSLLETLKAINKLGRGDFSGAGDLLKQALTNFSPAGVVGKGLNKIIPYPMPETQNSPSDYQAKRYTDINTPTSGYYGWAPEMYDENARNMAQDMAREAMLESNMSGGNQEPAGVIKVEVKLDANITAEKSEDVANTFVKMLDDKLQQTLTSYGYSGAQ